MRWPVLTRLAQCKEHTKFQRQPRARPKHHPQAICILRGGGGGGPGQDAMIRECECLCAGGHDRGRPQRSPRVPEAPNPFLPSCRCLPVQVSRSALCAVILPPVLSSWAWDHGDPSAGGWDPVRMRVRGGGGQPLGIRGTATLGGGGRPGRRATLYFHRTSKENCTF